MNTRNPRPDIPDGARTLRCRGGARARLIAEERQRALGWFYLSFASDYAFLGATIVWAHGFLTAMQRASDLGIDPGGEVICYPLPRKHLPRVPADLRDRLLSETEVRKRLGGKRMGE
jgi:hypothetical protein